MPTCTSISNNNKKVAAAGIKQLTSPRGYGRFKSCIKIWAAAQPNLPTRTRWFTSVDAVSTETIIRDHGLHDLVHGGFFMPKIHIEARFSPGNERGGFVPDWRPRHKVKHG